MLVVPEGTPAELAVLVDHQERCRFPRRGRLTSRRIGNLQQWPCKVSRTGEVEPYDGAVGVLRVYELGNEIAEIGTLMWARNRIENWRLHLRIETSPNEEGVRGECLVNPPRKEIVCRTM